jgi:poly-D-alanine transfer protein DltD
MYTRLQDLKKQSEIDLLFLGSSHAYRGFDPRIFKKFNIKSFNLGSSGQTPIQTELLMIRYFNKLKPKKIIFEVYPEMFSNDGVESSIDIICNDKIDYNTFKMVIKVNNPKTYNTFFYAYLRQSLKLDKYYLEPLLKPMDKYIKNTGFVERKLEYCNNCKNTNNIKSNIQLKPKQLESFNRIMKFFKKNNVEVILVLAPITKSKYKLIGNLNEINSFFSKYAQFYDFNALLNLDDDYDFYDTHHLNQNGVVKFNQFLIEHCL